jgi:CUB/sushi domain-containing protein
MLLCIVAKGCKYPIADDSKGCRVVGNKKKFNYSDTVKIGRKRGYCIAKDITMKCSSDGTWSPKAPECKPIRCPKPISPLHGKLSWGGDLLVGAWATFSCESGYDLNKNRTLSNYATRCTQSGNRKICDGVWSPKKPCCTPRSCDDPKTSNFKNGSIIGDAYFYPETIKLNCWEGYELVGDTSLFQCNHEGKWVEINESQVEDHAVVSQRVNDERKHAKECFGSNKTVTLPEVTNIRSFPTCEPKNCGRPAVHENCTASGNYFQYQGMVSYGRKPGFCLSGSDKIFCTASGVWSNTSPVCKRIRCPLLKLPSHGRIVIERTEYYVDDQADFICDSGYDLNMDRSIQSLTLRCQQSNDIWQCQGSWSKRPPCCIRKILDDLEVVSKLLTSDVN